MLMSRPPGGCTRWLFKADEPSGRTALQGNRLNIDRGSLLVLKIVAEMLEMGDKDCRWNVEEPPAGRLHGEAFLRELRSRGVSSGK